MAIQRIILDVAMLDGREHLGIVVTTADRMRLAHTARVRKWGDMQTDADRSITFLAWSVLERRGDFPGTFEDFVAQSETVSAPDKVDEVDPTQTATPAV